MVGVFFFFLVHLLNLLFLFVGLPRKLREADNSDEPFALTDPRPICKTLPQDMVWSHLHEDGVVRLQQR